MSVKVKLKKSGQVGQLMPPIGDKSCSLQPDKGYSRVLLSLDNGKKFNSHIQTVNNKNFVKM